MRAQNMEFQVQKMKEIKKWKYWGYLINEQYATLKRATKFNPSGNVFDIFPNLLDLSIYVLIRKSVFEIIEFLFKFKIVNVIWNWVWVFIAYLKTYPGLVEGTVWFLRITVVCLLGWFMYVVWVWMAVRGFEHLIWRSPKRWPPLVLLALVAYSWFLYKCIDFYRVLVTSLKEYRLYMYVKLHSLLVTKHHWTNEATATNLWFSGSCVTRVQRSRVNQVRKYLRKKYIFIIINFICKRFFSKPLDKYFMRKLVMLKDMDFYIARWVSHERVLLEDERILISECYYQQFIQKNRRLVKLERKFIIDNIKSVDESMHKRRLTKYQGLLVDLNNKLILELLAERALLVSKNDNLEVFVIKADEILNLQYRRFADHYDWKQVDAFRYSALLLFQYKWAEFDQLCLKHGLSYKDVVNMGIFSKNERSDLRHRPAESDVYMWWWWWVNFENEREVVWDMDRQLESFSYIIFMWRWLEYFEAKENNKLKEWRDFWNLFDEEERDDAGLFNHYRYKLGLDAIREENMEVGFSVKKQNPEFNAYHSKFGEFLEFDEDNCFYDKFWFSNLRDSELDFGKEVLNNKLI